MGKCCFNCKNAYGLCCGMLSCKIESPDSNLHYYSCCCDNHEMATEEQMKERNEQKHKQPYRGAAVDQAAEKFTTKNEYMKEVVNEAFCDGANFVLDNVIRYIETNRIWSGMGWKINVENLMGYLEELHGYPREAD